MDAFVEAHRGSTEDMVGEYEEELERMLELKRERMGAFVGSAREEVEKLWDDLMVGEEERGQWLPFFDGQYFYVSYYFHTFLTPSIRRTHGRAVDHSRGRN
jgi:protein regulator of cytokinesis 1